jgi:hypothetical protein
VRLQQRLHGGRGIPASKHAASGTAAVSVSIAAQGSSCGVQVAVICSSSDSMLFLLQNTSTVHNPITSQALTCSLHVSAPSACCVRCCCAQRDVLPVLHCAGGAVHASHGLSQLQVRMQCDSGWQQQASGGDTPIHLDILSLHPQWCILHRNRKNRSSNVQAASKRCVQPQVTASGRPAQLSVAAFILRLV